MCSAVGMLLLLNRLLSAVLEFEKPVRRRKPEDKNIALRFKNNPKDCKLTFILA